MSTIDIGPFWRAVCKSCRYSGKFRSSEYEAKQDLEKHRRENPDHKISVREIERRERDID